MAYNKHMTVYKRLPFKTIIAALEWEGSDNQLRRKIIGNDLTISERETVESLWDIQFLYARMNHVQVNRLREVVLQIGFPLISRTIHETPKNLNMEFSRGTMTKPRFDYILSKVTYFNNIFDRRVKELECLFK